MEQMFVESDKSLECGFILKETDVRRLVQLCTDQLKKIGAEETFLLFNIKHENGALAHTSNIEELFIEENTGSSKIIMLQVIISKEKISDGKKELLEKGNSYVKLRFDDLNSSNNNEKYSIKYKVCSTSRDWVMVTASLIQERIKVLSRNNFRNWGDYFFPLATIGCLIPLFLMMRSIPEKNNTSLLKVTQIENLYKAGKIHDTNQILFELEKAKLGVESSDGSKYTMFLIIPMCLMVVLVFTRHLKLGKYIKLYPLYNFCWGDYATEFDKIERRRKFVVGILIFTIVLGIIINLVSSYIWQRVN